MKKVAVILSVILCCAGAAAAAAQKTGTLKGKVENEKGKPIANADIRVMASRSRAVQETKTDQEGKYSFDLEPDEYSITIDVDGYRGGTLQEMRQVEEGRTTEVKTIRLEKGRRTSRISGAVFDSEGRSLGGAHLKLVRVPTAEEAKDKKKIDSISLSYTTNIRGEFAFRVPSARARYQVTASLSGYKPETKVVDVSEDEAVPLSFSLESSKK